MEQPTWEKASEKDKRFALNVPWRPVPLTLRELVDCFFEEHRATMGIRLPRVKKTAPSLFSRFLKHLTGLQRQKAAALEES